MLARSRGKDAPALPQRSRTLYGLSVEELPQLPALHSPCLTSDTCSASAILPATPPRSAVNGAANGAASAAGGAVTSASAIGGSGAAAAAQAPSTVVAAPLPSPSASGGQQFVAAN